MQTESNTPSKPHLPELPLDAWENSKMTLHLMLQIIGKIRLGVMPRKNHWWYITEYVSAKGITTNEMPYNDGQDLFEILLNLQEHKLEITTSQGAYISFELKGISVASFYEQLFQHLHELNISVEILDKPFDMAVDTPFKDITEYVYENEEYIQRFWRIMIWISGVFKEFSGRFYGKTCPVHIYWHHMDLTVTRFSGRKGPPIGSDWRISDKDAYTHEVISFGFWAGDESVREPAFYSYTYPSPEGLEKEPLNPDYANWIISNGSPMAFITYNDLRNSNDPHKDLLDFMESSYQAGAKLAKWDFAANAVPSLDEM